MQKKDLEEYKQQKSMEVSGMLYSSVSNEIKRKVEIFDEGRKETAKQQILNLSSDADDWNTFSLDDRKGIAF